MDTAFSSSKQALAKATYLAPLPGAAFINGSWAL
jgi:hypothetical protein